jgi:hypothetical protein
MSHARWATLVAAVLLWQTPLRAESITIEGEDPRRGITVTIDNATVDLVIKDLQAKYGFEVGGLQNVNKGDPISTAISGDLRNVLERLLRNWNYLIVRSPKSDGGIAKVVIIDASYGTNAPKVDQSAGGQSPDKVMQARSGS